MVILGHRHLAHTLDKEKQHIYSSLANPAMPQGEDACEDCGGVFKVDFL